MKKLMSMKWQKYALIAFICMLLLTVVNTGSDLLKQWSAALGVGAARSSLAVPQAPAPFMHRPYYGSASITSRTISFFDHDKPWYANDSVFVRYDGRKWTHATVSNCSAGVNCYDGHNGYDLGLYFEPVLSSAAGTVIRSGWYNAVNHNSSFGLWVAIDHGNGMSTAYGHLSAVTVAVGDHVGAQWQVGTSGTSGAATGPHLHMSAYYMPRWQSMDPFGWSGSGRDPNVVPDRYLWTNNPTAPGSAPDLSGQRAYPGAIVVDDSDPGCRRSGSWSASSAASDFRGSTHWTTTTSGPARATATWTPRLRSDGYYEVGVFVDDNHASSSWAPYTIYSADPAHAGREVRHVVHVDMSHIGVFSGLYGRISTDPQWIGLGTYFFRASMNGRVVLNNSTGGNGAQLAADGAEFVRTR